MHDRLRDYTKVEVGAEYNPGIRMDGGYTPEAVGGGANGTLRVCSACGEPGHLRKTNRLCKQYTAPRGRNMNTTEQANRDGAEQALLDEVAFDAEGDEWFDAVEMREDDADNSSDANEDDGSPVMADGQFERSLGVI